MPPLLLDKLTTPAGVVNLSNMKTRLMLDARHVISEDAFVEFVVWELPRPVSGSHHRFKYRLACLVNGECVLRYGNETGKGDHRHKGKRETTYAFSTPEKLIADFWSDVKKWSP
jgi:hypothetical protein